MMDAKEAKWFRMFNRLDVNDQRNVGENMSRLSNSIEKMERAIVEGSNIDSVNHVILEGNYAEKCIVRWIEICNDKGWELRVRKSSEDYTRDCTGSCAMDIKVSCYEINLRLKY